MLWWGLPHSKQHMGRRNDGGFCQYGGLEFIATQLASSISMGVRVVFFLLLSISLGWVART